MKSRWKQTAGFTLVELIVVIAILGILAGVAVPTYSGYVKKANMAADQNLANDVKTALSLQYLGHPGENLTGYVVLGQAGSNADEVGAAAMQATFGEGWQALALKYDGWAGSGSLLGLVSGMTQADAETVKDSTYLQNCSAEGMLGAVTGLLDIAAERIKVSNNVANHLDALGGDLATTMGTLNLDPNSDEYNTAIANLLVGHFADALVQAEANNSADTNSVKNLVTFYAGIYAYCEKSQDFTLRDELDDVLSGLTYDQLIANTNTSACMSALRTREGAKYQKYLEDYRGGRYNPVAQEKYQADQAALVKMMEAVSLVADEYKDKDSLINDGLYSSPEVVNQMNTYISAVKAQAAGKLPTIGDANGAVVVTLSADGKTSSSIDLKD